DATARHGGVMSGCSATMIATRAVPRVIRARRRVVEERKPGPSDGAGSSPFARHPTRGPAILDRRETEMVVEPGWRLLGFDIADGAISGLSNCGYKADEAAALRD